MGVQPAFLVIACGALAREIVALRTLNNWPHMVVQCLPAELHNRPEKIPAAVRAKIQAARGRFTSIFVAYADCGTGGLLDAVLAEEGVERIPGAHCYEFFAGSTHFAELAEAELGKSIKHDVSIPISLIGQFVKTTNAALQARFPGIQHIVFGHLGDGNLHYNVARAPNQTEQELLATQYDVYQLVHDSVHAHGGSISAEHGVGQLKRDELTRYKSELELRLMKQIKQALDPHGLMNPGKVLQA